MSRRPPTLSYSTQPMWKPPPRYPLRKFFGGLVAGLFLTLAFAPHVEGDDVLLFLWPLSIKIVAFLGLCFFREWRPLASGVLASMALGCLITGFNVLSQVRCG